MLWLFVGTTGVYLLDFFCSGTVESLSLLFYLDLYVLEDDAPFQGGTSFVDLGCFLFCVVFAMSLRASVYMCFVVTCWERADLLALVCGV